MSTETDETEPVEEKGQPDEPELSGLYCFINGDRVCNAACMAFVSYPRASDKAELNQGLHCIILSSLERTGRNVTAIAQMQAQAMKKQRISEADRQRTEQLEPQRTAVTSPFGKDRK